jgi:hypothetical protein
MTRSCISPGCGFVMDGRPGPALVLAAANGVTGVPRLGLTKTCSQPEDSRRQVNRRFR